MSGEGFPRVLNLWNPTKEEASRHTPQQSQSHVRRFSSSKSMHDSNTQQTHVIHSFIHSFITMPLLQRRQSPPPIEDETTMFPETVLLETSYDEELGSKQTEVSKLPFSHSQFPLQQGGGMISAPPLLDELNSDSDSSFESSSSLDVYSKIHHFPLEQNVEVCVDQWRLLLYRHYAIPF